MNHEVSNVVIASTQDIITVMFNLHSKQLKLLISLIHFKVVNGPTGYSKKIGVTAYQQRKLVLN